MSFITWKDVLSTGIKEIDEQHKDIVESINEFYDLSNKSGVQKEDLIEAFNKVIDHTIAHFTYEEELLEKQSIREKDIHAEAHEKFINNIFKLKDDFEKLNRSYFPNTDLNYLNEHSKKEIIEDIENDFEVAFESIKKLPIEARFGVYTAYRYYKRLLKKLKNTPSTEIKNTRIRVPDYQKIELLARCYVKYRLNLL